MRHPHASVALLGLPVALTLTVACFSSGDANTPPAPSSDCHAGFTGSVELPCRDASVPLDDAGAMHDGGVPAIDAASPSVDAAPADASVTMSAPFDAGVVHLPPPCTGTFGLDTTFASNGILLDPAEDGAVTLAVQADGKYLVGAESLVTRYNVDGTLDATFGQGGYVHYGDQTFPEILIPQPDGTIVVGGAITENGNTCLLQRILADGSPDTTFGNAANGGMASCALLASSSPTGFSQILQRPDGRFVAAGTSYPVTVQNRDFALVQYDVNGVPDPNFGGHGEALANFPSDAPIGPFTLQADGKAVVTGSATVERGDKPAQLAVARFNVDGSLDTTFGTGGRNSFTLPQAYGGPAAVVVQSTGAILIATVGGPTAKTFNVVRLTATGQLDTSYGTGGIASVSFLGEGDDAVALSLMADDSVLVGGNVQTPLEDAGYDISELGATHLLADGSLDTAFGTAGKVFLQIPNETEGSYWGSQVLLSSGTLLVGGSTGHLDDAGESVISDGILVRFACH